jgi:hypothetical protein
MSSTPDSAPAPAPAPASVPDFVPNKILRIIYHVPFPNHEHKTFEFIFTPVACRDELKVTFIMKPKEAREGVIKNVYNDDREYKASDMHGFLDIFYKLIEPFKVTIMFMKYSFEYDLGGTLKYLDTRNDIVNDYYGEEEGERDFDQDRFWQFILGKVMTFGIIMAKHSKYLDIMKELEGKECPVLYEPLKPFETIKLQCGHYLSMKAWNKQQGTLCPLCRKECKNGSNTYLG